MNDTIPQPPEGGEHAADRMTPAEYEEFSADATEDDATDGEGGGPVLTAADLAVLGQALADAVNYRDPAGFCADCEASPAALCSDHADDLDKTHAYLALAIGLGLGGGPVTTDKDLSHGIEELAGLISFRVGAWHDFGYETPPAPDCKPIPPLGKRSAEAVRAGHGAVEAIDELTRQLYALRQQLIDELRANQDALMAWSDARARERAADTAEGGAR